MKPIALTSMQARTLVLALRGEPLDEEEGAYIESLVGHLEFHLRRETP